MIFTYVRTVIKIGRYMRGNAQTEQVNLAQLLPLRETIFHTVEPRYNEGPGTGKMYLL